MIPTATHLSNHPGFSRAFAPGKLTLGFILPLEAYPNGPAPTMRDHAEISRLADDLGFAALWARDVATYDPGFGDVGQMFDPFTHLAFLASNTKRISLGTAASVITLRHPVHVAKQAASIDILSGGRMLLGTASGDRQAEYPLFNLAEDYESRGERFREAFAMIRQAGTDSFPQRDYPRFGSFDGTLDVIPKPWMGRLPAIVVGRSRQDVSWIAKHADGWLYYFTDLSRTELVVRSWQEEVHAVCGLAFKPFSQGLFFDLLEQPDAPARPIHSGMAVGRNALIEYLQKLRAIGVNHVAFNLKVSQRPVREVLEELSNYVLPEFPSQEECRPPPG